MTYPDKLDVKKHCICCYTYTNMVSNIQRPVSKGFI